MTKILIDLSDFKRVASLATVLRHMNTEFDAKSGSYVVDAKSLLGLYSLNLNNPVELTAYTEDPVELTMLYQELELIGAIGQEE